MLKNIFLGIMCLSLMCVAESCKKACAVNCLHNGSCDGSRCSCPDPYSGITCDTMCVLGYEGYQCQTLSREKFIGTWSCRCADQSGNISNFMISFTDNPYQLFVNLNNFNNVTSYPITCALTGKYEFTIDLSQQDSLATVAGISGSGQLNNGTLVLNISERNNISFFVTATKQ